MNFSITTLPPQLGSLLSRHSNIVSTRWVPSPRLGKNGQHVLQSHWGLVCEAHPQTSMPAPQNL